MAAKKKASSFSFTKIIFFIVFILAVFYAGNKFSEEKSSVEHAKEKILNTQIDTSTIENIKESVVKTVEEVVEKLPDVVEEKIDEITATGETTVEDIDVSVLPLSTEYGNPIELGDGKITYSDLKGLEISKKTTGVTTCAALSDYLDQNMGGYYWWNTCRDIVKDKGVAAFVLRLEEDEYIYEKHYLLGENNYYGVYELERNTTGELEDKLAFLKSKNAELKETNGDFGVLEIVNKLFKEILSN